MMNIFPEIEIGKLRARRKTIQERLDITRAGRTTEPVNEYDAETEIAAIDDRIEFLERML